MRLKLKYVADSLVNIKSLISHKARLQSLIKCFIHKATIQTCNYNISNRFNCRIDYRTVRNVVVTNACHIRVRSVYTPIIHTHTRFYS